MILGLTLSQFTLVHVAQGGAAGSIAGDGGLADLIGDAGHLGRVHVDAGLGRQSPQQGDQTLQIGAVGDNESAHKNSLGLLEGGHG